MLRPNASIGSTPMIDQSGVNADPRRRTARSCRKTGHQLAAAHCSGESSSVILGTVAFCVAVSTPEIGKKSREDVSLGCPYVWLWWMILTALAVSLGR
jgi:hypothetical protein